MEQKDYYLITQVHPEAETIIIKKLRQYIIRIYHPDHAPETFWK